MAFPEFCWYTVVSRPCTLMATYYPFGPQNIDLTVQFLLIVLWQGDYFSKGQIIFGFGKCYRKTPVFSVGIINYVQKRWNFVDICDSVWVLNCKDRQKNTFVCFLLGNYPASGVYMPTFRNTLSVPFSQAGRCEQSETRIRNGTGKILARSGMSH